MTCSNCGVKGQHNSRTCRAAPKKTRQERAQDCDSTPSSDSDSNTNEDDSSNQESLNSELLREAQWQAEMDYYNIVMAQAREIAERRRQEEVEDNDIQSDSELSAMDSSLLNGMEDIETSGVKSGDIEMGGTGAGLTD